MPKWGDGTLFVGSKGMLLADYGRHVLLPERDFKDYEKPKKTIHTGTTMVRAKILICAGRRARESC